MGQSEAKALLKPRARALRNQPTKPEQLLWKCLRASQLGFKFRRQVAIPPFIADFLCPQKGLVVEVDGWTHEAPVDLRRDSLLKSQGFITFRVTNIDVMENMEGVLRAITSLLETLPDRWPGNVPHPNPSPEGEGL